MVVNLDFTFHFFFLGKMWFCCTLGHTFGHRCTFKEDWDCWIFGCWRQLAVGFLCENMGNFTPISGARKCLTLMRGWANHGLGRFVVTWWLKPFSFGFPNPFLAKQNKLKKKSRERKNEKHENWIWRLIFPSSGPISCQTKWESMKNAKCGYMPVFHFLFIANKQTQS